MKRWVQTALAVVAGMVFSGCLGAEYPLFQKVEATKTSTQSTPKIKYEMEYKIMPYDRLAINIYNQSGMQGGQLSSILSSNIGSSDNLRTDKSTTLLVAPDGRIHLPLIGWVKVAGLTQFEAIQKLTEEYRKYLRKPFVSVDIINHRVFVIGEVRKPGVVFIKDGVMSLIEAIALSGDLKDEADRTSIKIIRGGLKHPQVQVVDLTNVSALQISTLFLQPDDIIYVQPRSMKGVNRDLKEILVPFDAIAKMLTPFVQIHVLTD